MSAVRSSPHLGVPPSVSGVMRDVLAAIKRKRSKDTMVLSAVVAFCVAFTLIYWLAK